MRTVITSIFAALLVSTGSGEPEIKGSATELAKFLTDDPRSVTIAGEAELKVQADRAVISLKVTTENKSLQEALGSNQELRINIAKALKDRGLADEQIQGSKFSSTPKYGMFGDKATNTPPLHHSV